MAYKNEKNRDYPGENHYIGGGRVYRCNIDK